MKLSIRASKLVSDKPSYKKKEKGDSGPIYRYDEKHVKRRWDLKKKQLKKLEKNIEKVRKQYKKDLTDEDLRTRALAVIVEIIEQSGMRVGNEESVGEHDTYGATTLKCKHVKISGGKVKFDFKGKDLVEQHIEIKDAAMAKVLKELMKGKKSDDFVFEVDGKKIWDRAVNRYLEPLGISAKDLRGYRANHLMKEILKKKDFKDALEEVAEAVGHKPSTLKNQYLDPELVEKYEKKEKKASLSIRAEEIPTAGPIYVSTPFKSLKPEEDAKFKYKIDVNRNVSSIEKDVKLAPVALNTWKILAPFMPNRATLSSSLRTADEQKDIILSYWHSYWGPKPVGVKGKGFFADHYPEYGKTLETMRKFMTEMYEPTAENTDKGGPKEKLTIAKPGESYHQTGQAIDITNISDYAFAEKTVQWVARYFKAYIDVAEIFIEEPQRNLHVAVRFATYPGPENMYHALRKFYYNIEPPAMTSTQSAQYSLSKRALSVGDFLPKPKSKVQRSQQLNISPGVKYNELILSAWATLKLFLPSGAVMTSGERDPQDQIRIINHYWKKSGLGVKYPAIQDSAERSRLLGQNGWVVAAPGKSPHETGRAFDVSGADLNEIASVARLLSNHPSLPINFSQILVEPKNNNVHITIQSAKWDPVAIENVLRGNTAIASTNTAKSILTKFPKICNLCGKQYNSAKEFLKQPIHGIVAEVITSKDPGLTCVDDYDIVFRDCDCESTLVLEVECFHNQIKNASEDESVESIYEDLVASDAPEEVIQEYEKTFGIKQAKWKDQLPGGLADKKKPEDFDPAQLEKGIKFELEHVDNKQLAKEISMDHLMEMPDYYTKLEKMEQEADDESGKYEKEKDDPKWQEVLIDEDKKWTRKAIRDHYIKNADRILKEIKGHPVMLYVNTGKVNQNVLKRNHNDKPIEINSKEDLEYWADRRLLSIHRVFNKETDLGFVDLDVHENFPQAKVVKYAKEISKLIKSKYNSAPTIYDSGGTGYHVEFNLKEKKDADTLRNELRDMAEELNKKYDGFTTGIVKGSGVRTDTTTLKQNGNLRVPYALHEKYGGIKKPLSSDKKAFSIRADLNLNEESGFGIPDKPGDFFEKSPEFVERKEKTDYRLTDLSEDEARALYEKEPEQFFYKGLHKKYPNLEASALTHMLVNNAKFYFNFSYDEREEPEFQALLQPAAENLSQQDPRAFFYHQLHFKFPEIARGAIIKLIDTNPDSFFDLGLEAYFPDYTESANAARNIKDPNKVELELDQLQQISAP